MYGLLKEKVYYGYIFIDIRMIEMFYVYIDVKLKEKILIIFCFEGGIIRILICIVVVGLGINILDISIVFIWGLCNFIFFIILVRDR